MGFFSKVWKGVKKTFKKIGGAIKSGFKKFGKFMGKIGIVGQIAMMFILPGIGNAMMGTFKGIMSGLGALGKVGQAAQTVLGAAGNFARLVAKPFTTITDAVGSFVSNTSKYLANKIPGMDKLLSRAGVNITNAPDSFFGLGENSVIGRVGTGISNNVQGFVDIGRDLMTGNLQPFGVGVPPASSPASGVSIDPTAEQLESFTEQGRGFNRDITPEDIYRQGTASLDTNPSLLDMQTPASPAGDLTKNLLPADPTANVAAKQTLGETLGQKFRDTFTVENVVSTGIDKSFDAVVSTGTAAILDPVLGEKPPEEPMGIAYTPQFQATDYSGITEDPLRADTFADYTQRISTGFDDRGLVSSGGAWNNWMRSNLAA